MQNYAFSFVLQNVFELILTPIYSLLSVYSYPSVFILVIRCKYTNYYGNRKVFVRNFLHHQHNYLLWADIFGWLDSQTGLFFQSPHYVLSYLQFLLISPHPSIPVFMTAFRYGSPKYSTICRTA